MKEIENTKEFLYENLKELSQAQDDRKKEIDNKVNMLLTICLAVLAILVEFVKIKNVIALSYDNPIWNNVLRIFSIMCYIGAIVISLIVIIKLVCILRSKLYRTIEVGKVANARYMSKEAEQMVEDFIETYAKNIEENSKTNEKQMNTYAYCVVLFIVELFLVIGTYVGVILC